jgi:polysaccharide pyruvyl transferase CsaB
LIVGYFGFGNAGDEAILASMLSRFREAGFAEGLTVCGGATALGRDHDVRSVDWRSTTEVLEAIESADVVLLGGGGLFHDQFGVDPDQVLSSNAGGLAHLGGIVAYAALCHKRIAVVGAGVGPLFTEIGREITANIMKVAGFISVRDHGSVRELLALGMDSSRIAVAADYAFSSVMPARTISETGNIRIGVCARDWNRGVDSEYWIRELARALDTMTDDANAEISLIPFQIDGSSRSDDRSVAVKIRDLSRRKTMIAIAEPTTFRQIQQLVAGCDVLIGMRLHSLVFAMNAGVPLVAIRYDPKISSLMSEAQLQDWEIPLEELTSERLCRLVRRALDEAEPFRESLRRVAATSSARSNEAFGMLREWLNHGSDTDSSQTNPDLIRRFIRARAVASEAAAARIAELAGWTSVQEVEIVRLKELEADLWQKLESSNTNANERSAHIADLQKDVQRLDVVLAESARLHTMLEAGQRELRVAEVSLSVATVVRSVAERALEERNVLLVDLQATLDARDKELETAAVSLAMVTVARSEAESSLAELDARCAKLSVALSDAESTATNHHSTLDRVRAESENQRARIDELATWSTAQTLHIEELSAWTRTQQESIEALQALRDGLVAEVGAARGEIARLEQEKQASKISSRIRRAVHPLLGAVQAVIPEPLRRAVRPVYLPIYSRMFAPNRQQEQSLVSHTAVVARVTGQASSQPQFSHSRNVLPASSLKISIILPVWNHGRFLPEAIRTTLAQTFKSIEVIVIDDGSTEDLLPGLRPWLGDERLLVIRHPHSGLPRTLSCGFRYATGDLLTWTSADNFMKPHMLDVLERFLRRRPDVDVAYADMELIDDRGAALFGSNYRVTAQRPGATNQLSLPRTVATLGLVNDNFIGASFLYRAWLGRALGDYDDSGIGTEDYDYWLRATAAGIVEHVDTGDCLYEYRVHDDTLSTRHSAEITQNAESLVSRHKERREREAVPFDIFLSSTSPEDLRSLAAVLARSGQRITTGGLAELGAWLQFDQPKRMVIWLDADTTAGASALTVGAESVLFLALGMESAEETSNPLHWALCRTERERSSLSGALVRHNLLLPEINLALESDILLNLKARDNRWPLWDLPQFDEPMVLYLGPIRKEAIDWSWIRRVMNSLRTSTFLFISTSPDIETDPRAELKDRTGVVFLGYKRPSEWHAYLSRASLTIAPLLRSPSESPEYCGILLSYAAAARPVLATHIVGDSAFAELPGLITTLEPDAHICSDALGAKPTYEAADAFLERWKPVSIANRLIAVANAQWEYHQHRRHRVRSVNRRAKVLMTVETLDRGGLERVVADMTYSLRRKGYEVIVAARRGGEIAAECAANGIEVHTECGVPEVATLLLRSRPDVVLSHYSFDATETIWRSGIPHIGYVHNSYVWTTPEQDARIRESAHLMQHHIAVSESARAFFCKRYGIAKHRVDLIPNGIDGTRFHADGKSPHFTRASLGLSDRDYVFLLVGSVIGTKAQVHAVSAMREVIRRHPSAKLLLVGPEADSRYGEVLKRTVEDLNLGGSVRLLDATVHIGDLYRIADAFLLTSLIEGWSLAKTEAMYHGLPLILTRVGGAEQVVEADDIGILVPPAYDDVQSLNMAAVWSHCIDRNPSNLPALVEAMSAFCRHRNDWREKGRMGRQKVISQYTIEASTKRQAEVIETILDRHWGSYKEEPC